MTYLYRLFFIIFYIIIYFIFDNREFPIATAVSSSLFGLRRGKEDDEQ
jgi:hypothetical protein